MVPVAVAGNFLGEATTPSGNIFNEAMRRHPDPAARRQLPANLIVASQDQHHQLGEDFRLAHNPHAGHPLPQDFLARGEEVRVSLGDGRFEISGRLLP